MAQNIIDATGTALSSAAKFFFYVKGSKDYPIDQVISDPFGYDNSSDGSTAQTAVFESSIKDVILRSTNPKQIDNLYSLYSDTSNSIAPRNTRDGLNIRNDRSQEYLSSIIIDNGKVLSSSDTDSTKFIDHIDPNFSSYLDGTTSKAYTLDNVKAFKSSGITENNMYPLEHIFWQKMFTICEYIKKYESEIVSMYADSSIKLPSFMSTAISNGNAEKWYETATNVELMQQDLAAENAIGRFLALFIGKCTDASKHFITHYESGDKTLYNGYIRYNPIRWKEVTGEDELTHSYTEGSTFEYTINEEQEMFWSSSVLNIQYVYGSGRFEISSHDNRLKYFQFQVKAEYTGSISKIWTIQCYLDADGFVNSNTKSKYAVYTYNDDLDEVSGSKDDGYGIYDNDYANVASSSSTMKNNFVTSSSEFENNIIAAITNIMKDGEYKYYTVFQTLRVTPTTVDSNGNKSKTIVWDSINHSIMQKFFIFYGSTTSAPSTSEQIDRVKSYIKNLHTSGKCHATTYDDDGYVKYIGHTDTDLDQFLANMYPELFTTTEVYITPSDAIITTSGASASWDPTNYYSSIDLETAYNRLHSLNGIFSAFEYSTSGSSTLVSSNTSQKNLPIEFVNVGGILDSESSSSTIEFKYPMPLICTSFGTSDARPLTSLSGFANYKPKFFTYNSGDTNFSYADKLQIVLIKLLELMFTQASTANYFTSICGIPISYSVDTNADSDLEVTGNSANVAKFVINNVNFTVISLKGKPFKKASSKAAVA